MFIVTFTCKSYSQLNIAINCSQTSNTLKHQFGLLHGTDSTSMHPTADSLLSKIDLKYWRTKGDINYELAFTNNINSMIVLSDLYAFYKGGYSLAQPWLDWNEYETFIDTVVDILNANSAVPDYFDVWNEPDLGMYWTGNYPQLIECYKRTINVIKNINPNFKVVGPGLSNYYGGTAILDIIDTLNTIGSNFDAVNWHEFVYPIELKWHVQQMRDSLDIRPYASNMEIQITEYAAADNSQIPGFLVGFSSAFEKSPVDWVSMACWDVTDGTYNWSTCWNGFNGLFWKDEIQPLPAYWVQRAYTELSGLRINSNANDTTFSIIAVDDTLNNGVRILTGRHYNFNWATPSTPINVSLNVSNYPYLLNGKIPIVIQKIPNQNIFSPLYAPILVLDDTINVSGGIININLQNYSDGDAYYIYLYPQQPTILNIETVSSDNNSEIKLFPNPFSSSVTLESETAFINANLILYNSFGQQVKQINAISGKTYTLQRDNLSNGIYFLRLEDDNNIITTYKLVIAD